MPQSHTQEPDSFSKIASLVQLMNAMNGPQEKAQQQQQQQQLHQQQLMQSAQQHQLSLEEVRNYHKQLADSAAGTLQMHQMSLKEQARQHDLAVQMSRAKQAGELVNAYAEHGQASIHNVPYMNALRTYDPENFPAHEQILAKSAATQAFAPAMEYYNALHGEIAKGKPQWQQKSIDINNIMARPAGQQAMAHPLVAAQLGQMFDEQNARLQPPKISADIDPADFLPASWLQQTTQPVINPNPYAGMFTGQ